MERSYVTSEAGLKQAEKEFRRKGWTQQLLADFAVCSRPVVSNFFKAKPVDKQKFISICEALNLEWIEIAELEAEKKLSYRREKYLI